MRAQLLSSRDEDSDLRTESRIEIVRAAHDDDEHWSKYLKRKRLKEVVNDMSLITVAYANDSYSVASPRNKVFSSNRGPSIRYNCSQLSLDNQRLVSSSNTYLGK